MIRRILNLYRFTTSERRSLIILCAFLVLLNGFSFVVKSEKPDESFFVTESKSIVPVGDTKPLKAQEQNTKVHPPKSPQIRLIEINGADSTELLDLYGIGPAFAGRIVKYRNLLGGYFHCNQLLEVYGMDTLRYNGFKSRIRVDQELVKKMNINTSGFRDFLKHPYLDYEAVKKVVRYRDQQGPMSSPHVLWTDSILNMDLKDKLLPYLFVN